MIENVYKGFTRDHLEWEGWASFTEEGVVIPYRTINGDLYREKLFSEEGRAIGWLGGKMPQIPYGLETLAKDSESVNTAFLTEGESCAWTLRAAFPECPVLGLPGASSWQEGWACLLDRFPVVYLSFDADEAGRGLLDTVWPDVPWARRVELPEGLDTRDLIQLHGGVEAYERLLDDADHMAGVKRAILECRKGVVSGVAA